ncbi:hypothetical protein B6U80_01095 [Candidatus Pacearchaeota archaeon ex4484_26]|nr:MAG: hypothetical protein B6U80_01095 [Candidatus Pacearchaeota archaeon ex4484_26]
MFLFLKHSLLNRKVYIGWGTISIKKMRIKKNKSVFLEVFGDTPKLRCLDFLIENHFFDYPVTEIARQADVSYNSIKLFFDKWVKEGILIKTRKVGKSDYYKLNINNIFIKNLIKLDWILTKKMLIPEIKEKVMPKIPV